MYAIVVQNVVLKDLEGVICSVAQEILILESLGPYLVFIKKIL
jgi:hypothetical protein